MDLRHHGFWRARSWATSSQPTPGPCNRREVRLALGEGQLSRCRPCTPGPNRRRRGRTRAGSSATPWPSRGRTTVARSGRSCPRTGSWALPEPTRIVFEAVPGSPSAVVAVITQSPASLISTRPPRGVTVQAPFAEYLTLTPVLASALTSNGLSPQRFDFTLSKVIATPLAGPSDAIVGRRASCRATVPRTRRVPAWKAAADEIGGL